MDKHPPPYVPGAGIFTWWTTKHRESNLVKASQPALLHLITLGSVIALSTIFCIGLDEQWFDPAPGVAHDERGYYAALDAACIAQVWLYFIGFGVSMGTLFAKLWRVKQILVNPSLRAKNVSVRQTLGYVFVLVCYFVMLLLANVATDPPWYYVPRQQQQVLPLELTSTAKYCYRILISSSGI